MKKENLSVKVLEGKNGAQYLYLLECISGGSRAADDGVVFKSDFEIVSFFFRCFDAEFNHEYNKRIYPNICERIGNYLQGLPSSCPVEYWNDGIIKLGVSWGVLTGTNNRANERFLSNYWHVLGQRLVQMADKLGVNYNL